MEVLKVMTGSITLDTFLLSEYNQQESPPKGLKCHKHSRTNTSTLVFKNVIFVEICLGFFSFSFQYPSLLAI